MNAGLGKQTIMISILNFRSVRAALTVGLTFATVALWNVAAHAAEPTSHGYRTANPGALVSKLPATIHGSCRITEKLETRADGSQVIRRHTVCKGK